MNKRSVLAVVAGLLFVIVVTTLVDIVLHATGYFPTGQLLTETQALVATAYRLVISVAGAWLTARLAPNRPMAHALTLGGFGLVLGLVGVVATWNLGLGPRWYPIALAALAIPQCWLGGKLFEMRTARA